MRVIHVSTADRGGGAEAIAMLLHRAYLEQGHDSWLAVGARRTEERNVIEIPNDALRNPWARFWTAVGRPYIERAESENRFPWVGRMLELAVGQPRRFVSRMAGREDFSFPGSRRLLTLVGKCPDLIHTHNLHGRYFDLTQLSVLSQNLPLVMTLHDAWLLSGHCAHSFACERWLTGCGKCPDLRIYPEVWRDGTAGNYRRKQAIYAGCRLYVATPSQWLMDKVKRSMLAPAIVDSQVIPNGVDLSIFRPGDQATARIALELPQDVKIILFACFKPHQNPFKDYSTLLGVMKQIGADAGEEKYLLLVLGDSGAVARYGNLEVRGIPAAKSQREIAGFYQAADLYVQAAKADTFPTTVLEAMACGTPVVGTAVGGIPEQIDHGRTGMLVPPGDAEAMARAIQSVLAQPELRREMGNAAAAVARMRFDQTRMVDSYLQWYKEILSGYSA